MPFGSQSMMPRTAFIMPLGNSTIQKNFYEAFHFFLGELTHDFVDRYTAVSMDVCVDMRVDVRVACTCDQTFLWICV